jgi:hypothetical protein
MISKIAHLVRRGLSQRHADPEVAKSAVTGLPVIRLGAVITTEDVHRVEDEEE